jgi:hypothetical protein
MIDPSMLVKETPTETDDRSFARRVKAGVLAVVALLGGIAVAIWFGRETPDATETQTEKLPAYVKTPVPSNRGAEVQDGFRGNVHPLLTGSTSLELTAHCSEIGRGRDQLDKSVPEAVYRLFSEFTPVAPRHIYTERDFSAFLPESIEGVGQMWEMDVDRVAGFLRQFHERPLMHLVALGRRAGPNGAFAVLRAVSATHLEIVFRVHAEFDLAQNVWLTPACFLGRMIIDREAGTVVHFRMWVPTDNPLNLHLTVAESMKPGDGQPQLFRKIERGDVVISKRDIVRIEQMELSSEDRGLTETLDWSDAIGMPQAERKLASAFYVFADIEWVPWKEAVRLAGERHMPVLAIVLWGALDDQSC